MPGLFSPVNVRGLRLKNRLVMPPMANQLANERGEATDRHVRHYVSRARAGVGLIVVEHAYVLRTGRVRDTQLGAHADSLVPGLRRLADEVHAAGAAIAMQINHAGAKCVSTIIGEQPAGPTTIAPPGAAEQPRAFTTAEIDAVVDAFAAAARRCQEAGFDAVEVHAAHGFLLSQFLSPLTNWRTDLYGGPVENRGGLHLEVVRAVRAAIGPELLLLVRLGASDDTPGGLELADSLVLAPLLAEAGMDLLDVSGGLQGSRPEGAAAGYFVRFAEPLRRVAGVPVLVTGGITDPRHADALVRQGRTDLVGVGRAMLSNPRWAADAILTLR